MKQSSILAERIRHCHILDRTWAALRRPGSVRRLAAGFVLTALTVVAWAFPSLGQRETGLGNDPMGALSYFPPDARTEVFHHQSLEKARLAGEVLDGRRTFGEAVTAFRSLHAIGPHRESLARFYHPGCMEEEAIRWNVVAFLRSALNDRPEKAAQVEQIEKEMEHATRMGEESRKALPDAKSGG